MNHPAPVQDSQQLQAPDLGQLYPDTPRFHLPHLGIWAALIVLVILSLLVAPGTLRVASLYSMLPLAGALAIAAAGQTLVVQQRGFDLSVPGTMSLTAMIACTSVATGRELTATLGLATAAVVAVGLLNGLLVVRLAITPLVATLATNALVMGVVWTLSDGLPVAAPDALAQFVRRTPIGLPTVALIALAIVAVLAAFQTRLVAGRNFLAAGASPTAARAAGILTNRHVTAAYVASSACAGLAGVLLAGYAGTATLNIGDPYLLPAVAAVIVGGAPLKGGGGSVVATALAALFLTQLVQITLALGAPTSSQLLVQSLAIVLAVLLRSMRLTAWRPYATRSEGRT
ncbi:ABC transporter permease [Kribbella sancticallisti]|uniref:ABC transporter permease n=1 Tax=Kribbella sancticallisti TaxID=460087 RepID=A0ABN2EYG9_9ACTN